MSFKELPFTREEIWTLPLEELIGPDWREQVQRLCALLEHTRPEWVADRAGAGQEGEAPC